MSGLSHRPMTHGTGLRGSSRVGAFYWVLALRSTAWKVQKRKKEVRLTEGAGTFQVHAAQQVHVNKALGRRSGELKLCRAVGLSYSIAGALIVNTTISLLRNGPALIHRRPKKKRGGRAFFSLSGHASRRRCQQQAGRTGEPALLQFPSRGPSSSCSLVSALLILPAICTRHRSGQL